MTKSVYYTDHGGGLSALRDPNHDGVTRMADDSILPPNSKAIYINHVGDRLCVIVDDDDYGLLSRHTWYIRSASVTNFYPATTLLVRDTGLRKLIAMHHMIMGVGLIDHINGNKLDNRKCNLRKATYSQNGANSRKPKSNGGKATTSKYKGVCLDRAGVKKKWLAQIAKDDRRYSLGRFYSEEAAAIAYNEKAVELYGEFAKLNIIPDDYNPQLERWGEFSDRELDCLELALGCYENGEDEVGYALLIELRAHRKRYKR